ncbi:MULTISPECIES: hypothetical protein [unclassified Nodularia (in: cyanobacteria)]|uniref:hypothetical protein n=1 Tax=unclassified Nodularia (in: cyanobacteria) TaxID=2656917 RepID=UPI001D117A8D|nr:hypothetical protein [Nodularia sp. LEGE 04288]MCC2691952.1 hypothetical protein [Nodularia sp. LEGE 04288]
MTLTIPLKKLVTEVRATERMSLHEDSAQRLGLPPNLNCDRLRRGFADRGNRLL